MIIKIRPDKSKSRSLKIIAEITLERLENTDREKYPTNTLNDYYDSIHKLMEAISMLNGITFSNSFLFTDFPNNASS